MATPQNIAYLSSYVNNLIARGGTFYNKAFSKAFDLMKSAEPLEYDNHERSEYNATHGLLISTTQKQIHLVSI